MNRTTAVAALAAGLMLLTGCTATATAPTVEQVTSAAPLVAQSPTVSASTDSSEAAFIAEYREQGRDLPGGSQIPDATDAQLIAAGRDACSKLDAGADPDELSVVEGETKNSLGYYGDTGAIATAARLTICPIR